VTTLSRRPTEFGGICLAVGIGGCSDGVYSATADGNGNIIVVNHFTGEARSIRGDIVVDVKPLAPSKSQAAGAHRPVLYPLSITGQLFSIRGLTKFRDGNLLLRATVGPAKASMTE